jgi:serine acetyltransferase
MDSPLIGANASIVGPIVAGTNYLIVDISLFVKSLPLWIAFGLSQ